MGNAGEYVPPIGGYRWADNFDKLLCSNCEKYLSVGPILTSTDGQVNICGRCDEGAFQSHGEFYRNVLYESIAKFLLFPSNSGCICKTLWNSVTIHDQDCPEKRIDCFDPDCPAFVRCEEVIAHFQHVHRIYKGYSFDFYLGVLSSGVRLIEIDTYIFVFSYVVRFSTLWFNMFNVNYVNKQTLHFRLKTLDSPMRPDLVNNRYRIRLWNQFLNMLYTDEMYHLSIPLTSASRPPDSFYVVELIIENIGIEDAAVCLECDRMMVEENCCMCHRGHTYCLDCYQEAEFCPDCTNLKMKSLRSNWILDVEDDDAAWDY
ncbi:hypothetical protein HUJ05_010668 [Dendroctonus ponderosae]|nr:hypothetical protein HUJ05_010668 [Dendroctonus ponderosae]